MDIYFSFDNKGEDDVWVCLSGPVSRSSDCQRMPHRTKTDLKYVATDGFGGPQGEWTCNVFSSSSNCEFTFDTIAHAEVGVGKAIEATVEWFYDGRAFADPPAKVKYVQYDEAESGDDQ